MLTGGDIYGITVDDNCIYALQVDSTQEHLYCLRAYDAQGKLQRTVTTFDQADVYGLCCDSITGALYWIQTSTLYRWQNGNAEPLRILPLDWLTTRRAAVFAQKYVAAVGTGGLYLFDMSADTGCGIVDDSRHPVGRLRCRWRLHAGKSQYTINKTMITP